MPSRIINKGTDTMIDSDNTRSLRTMAKDAGETDLSTMRSNNKARRGNRRVNEDLRAKHVNLKQNPNPKSNPNPP